MLELVRSADALAPRFRSFLRLVRPGDAEFVFALRRDSALNAHLSPPPLSDDEQRDWIRAYEDREGADQEFYFVIVSDRQDRGVIRMYDFRDIAGERSFAWGSWIIRPPRPPGLATFSAITMYELGFDVLGFDRAHFEVGQANTRVTAFHERAGAHLEREDDQTRQYVFRPEDYIRFRRRSLRQIEWHRVLLGS